MYLPEDEMIRHLSREVHEGNMSFAQVRSKMEDKNIPENEIKQIIRAVDDLILTYEVERSLQKSGRREQYAGITLMTIDVVITVGSFLLTEARGYGVYIFSIGLFIAGSALYKNGRKKAAPLLEISERLTFNSPKRSRRK